MFFLCFVFKIIWSFILEFPHIALWEYPQNKTLTPHKGTSLLIAAGNLQWTEHRFQFIYGKQFLKSKHIFHEQFASLKTFSSVLPSYIKLFIILEYIAIDIKINGWLLNSHQLLSLLKPFHSRTIATTDLMWILPVLNSLLPLLVKGITAVGKS